MKKIITILLATAIFFVCTSCGRRVDYSQEAAQARASQTPTSAPLATRELQEAPSPAPTPEPEPSDETTADTSGFDFRNTNWGMTREQVIASESADYDEDLSGYDYLLYRGVYLADYDTNLYYMFNENGLLEGAYYSLYLEEDVDVYLDAFFDIEDALYTKYGEPDEYGVYDADGNELPLDDTEEILYMVDMGEAMLSEMWIEGDQYISLDLFWDTYFYLYVSYYSPQYTGSDTLIEGL